MTTALANVQYRPTELDTLTLGQVMVKSGFFKDTKDEAQAIVKILYGRELGFGPMASVMGVYIVNGRPSLSAQLIASAIQRSQRFNYRVREWTAKVCRIEFFEQRESLGDSSFTIEEAQAAQLTGKDVWKQYPKAMLWARALSQGARAYCPEVFSGAIYTPEELGAVVDGEGIVIEEAPVNATTGEVQTSEPDRDAAMQEWVLACEEAGQLGIDVKPLPENTDTAKIERWTAALHDKIYATREANGGTLRNH